MSKLKVVKNVIYIEQGVHSKFFDEIEFEEEKNKILEMAKRPFTVTRLKTMRKNGSDNMQENRTNINCLTTVFPILLKNPVK